ncbi:hypothetical protein QX51_12050 [Terrisporobacter othiniensis]|uniref:Abortive phage infection protein C-terminal domain-containing protein n=1 Tax=Terrisporobacter othiniensis TaxID=1577792 RepID=A0A0B3VV82_9FIRM|nr:AIPR family protein [Terrisporobacter othiniensis]KHS56708.1 hypothetical protein QX51_12050 [Terrisporobacter othiniensis]
MANINDFKIVNMKSLRMFDYLGIDTNKDIQKMRLGFYHLILENITGLKEVEEIKSLIIDTDYNKIVNNININDLGIDAVYINDDSGKDKEIQLFNFKFRENFKVEKTKSENDLSTSTKFLQYLTTDKNLDDLDIDYIVKEKIVQIRELLDSNMVCNITLYMVSNEANGYARNSDEYIELLEKSYGMKIINISLDDIIGFFNVLKDDQQSKFMISPNDFLSFENDEKSTKKSYIIKMSLIDLIRITCSSEELANNYAMEDDNLVDNCLLDFSLLYDNVRGYLGETKYNKSIKATLKDKHKDFFMFNNGITLTAKGINCAEKNSGKKYLFTINGFQIVNGGQTLRSIYKFLQDNNDSDKFTKLREAFVLVRMFNINEDDTLKNSIAEYTNSQNSISPVDLKSVDKIQIQIERYFKEARVLYARKAGDLGDIDVSYDYRISMERLAQILYSVKGYPDRATNQKKRLFQEYYEEIFECNEFTLEDALKYSNSFIEIEKRYKKEFSKFKYYEQKAFYIIYILKNTELSLEDAIKKLEELIESYNAKASDARKLVQKGFKEHVNKILNIEEQLILQV